METIELPVVKGFRFAGVAAGLKKSGAADLGAIVADQVVTAAAVFTRNVVKAAPVVLAAQRVAGGHARAVLANAGCANACTGAPGMSAAKATTRALARALGCSPSEVLPASTGVIGALLPADTVNAAIPALVADLREDNAMAFARAICTTDRWPKTAHHQRDGATVVGIAKGAGMIHPDMATTLAFLMCDARATAVTLRRALRMATEATFNRVTVDGDTSTNDTIVAMCSGAAGGPALGASTLAGMFFPVLDALARSIVADGEGSEHVVTITVEGCASHRAARAIATTIATSPLVKTALHGQDPNWGRILAAAGRAGVDFDPGRASITVGDVPIVARGMAVGAEAEASAKTRMARPTYEIVVRLGAGAFRASYVTCDLGHAYINVNANYRS